MILQAAEALILQRGKRFVSIFNEDVTTRKGSSNSEMFSCWKSERVSFSENSVVNFTVGCFTLTTKSCVKIEARTDNRSGILSVKQYQNLSFYDFKQKL